MKRTIITGFVLFCGMTAFGQSPQNRNEISVWTAGGLSTFNYHNPKMEKNMASFKSAGGFFGVGYSYFFNYNWSIGTGAELSFLNSETRMPLFSDTYLTPDVTSEHIYRIQVEGKDFAQRHSAQYVNIPLSIQFQANPNRHGHRWYVAAAAKAGIPFRGKYRSSGTMTTKGWEFASEDELISNTPITEDPYIDMPQHGFGSYDLESDKRNFDFKFNVIASLETGMKWRLSKNGKCHLYTGLFIDCGILDVRKNNKVKLFEFNPKSPAHYNQHSVFESRYQSGDLPYDENSGFKPYVDKVNTLAAGIKLRLAFGSNPFARKEKTSSAAAANGKTSDALTAEQARAIINDEVNRLIAEEWKMAQLREAQQAQAKEAQQAQTKEAQQAPVKPERKPDAGKQARDEVAKVAFDALKFETASHTIRAVSYKSLDNLAEAMKQNPEWKLTVKGYTDNSGSASKNLKLSRDRANAVKEYLENKGIEKGRISAEGYGSNNPVASNSTAEGRAKNRRVEFSLTGELDFH